MAKESELQKASLAGYKLLALTKAAAYASDCLEKSEVSELFDLANDLSDRIVVYLQKLEIEAKENCNG